MSRQNVETRRAQLLEQGRVLFSSQPYDAIGMDDIARAAGISKGLLYHYFASKRAYYVATVQSLADELSGLLEFPVGDDPLAALALPMQAFLDFIEQNATFYRALLRGGIGMDAETHTILEGVRQTVLARLMAAMGVPDEPVVRLRLYGCVGFAEHTSLAWLETRTVERRQLLQLWQSAFAAVMT